MAARAEAQVDSLRSPRTNAGDERCPLCNQALPHDLTAAELQARLREHEQKAAQAQEQRLRTQFARDMTAKIEETKKQEAAAATEREKVIRLEARTQAAAAAKEDLAKAQQATTKAQREKGAAEERLKRMKAEQDEQIKQHTKKALAEQRESLDKERVDAIAKAKSEDFEKNQKLQKQVEVLKRQLEEKTADSLGEGAEVDLYEALRGNFDEVGDKIARIKKGQPGADVRHEVRNNGQLCGVIVYDSKNHAKWRNSFVSKLKSDQLAAHADHAVLTAAEFPSGIRQFAVRDGVIVLNPARAVEVVRLLREHIIQTHRLRLSAKEKNTKTEALYKFINSDRCRQLLDRYESINEQLLEIDAREVAAHNLVWRKRGQLLKDAEKTHADYRSAIDGIIEDGSTE
jgi:hypothetical protein